MQKALSYAKVFVSWWGWGLDISFGQQVGCTDQMTTGTSLSRVRDGDKGPQPPLRGVFLQVSHAGTCAQWLFL